MQVMKRSKRSQRFTTVLPLHAQLALCSLKMGYLESAALILQ